MASSSTADYGKLLPSCGCLSGLRGFSFEGLTAMGYKVEIHAGGAKLIDYHGDERPERSHVIIGI
jgi:hypothetical protein